MHSLKSAARNFVEFPEKKTCNCAYFTNVEGCRYAVFLQKSMDFYMDFGDF